MDDYGLPPVDVRQNIIDTTGLFRVVINNDKGAKAKVAKALMNAFGISLNSAIECAKKAIDAGGIRGTIHEVKLVGSKLGELDFQLKVYIRKDNKPGSKICVKSSGKNLTLAHPCQSHLLTMPIF